MNYYVFSDEAGVYKPHPNEAFVKSNPFYIRAYVLMSIDEYREYQKELEAINKQYAIPINEEIKWSDLGGKYKNSNPRSDTILNMSINCLMQYYDHVLDTATVKNSVKFIFTITDNRDNTYKYSDIDMYIYHLQNAFQRIQKEMRSKDFATFFVDEINKGIFDKIKAACYEFTEKGDFVEYNNLYHGIISENSIYSPGIQLADYVAGIMNSYLRRNMLSPCNYQFAANLYDRYIKSNIRHSAYGTICGYGVVNTPGKTPLRSKLENIFDTLV